MINQRIDASTDQTQLLVQLLLGSGMLTRDEMSEFRTIAQDLRLPLSQTLSNSGRFSKETLEKCSDAMNRIQSKQISLDLAIRALRVAVQKKLPFNEAIESAKSLHRTTLTVVSAANELTSLLMDVRILTQEQLGQLLKSQSGSALMIGQQMVLENIISIEALLQALHALVLIRSGGLSKPNAIDGLKYAYENRVSIEQALFELDTFVQPDAKELRIGELYFFAGLISLDQYVECLEIEMFKKKEFGQILVERGLTRQETLASALEFLSAVANNLLKPHEAAELLVAAGRNMRPAYALIAECQRARRLSRIANWAICWLMHLFANVRQLSRLSSATRTVPSKLEVNC